MSLLDPGGFSGFKRPRLAFEGSRHTKRPISKSIIAVTKAGMDSTQVTTTLLTVTFPCTIVGIRWEINCAQDAGTALSGHNWAIVIVKEGVTVDTSGTADAATYFNPEQNCLTWGIGQIDSRTETKTYTGSTKTMRKMQGGDILMFIARGEATNTTSIKGLIQFFCKT